VPEQYFSLVQRRILDNFTALPVWLPRTRYVMSDAKQYNNVLSMFLNCSVVS